MIDLELSGHELRTAFAAAVLAEQYLGSRTLRCGATVDHDPLTALQ